MKKNSTLTREPNSRAWFTHPSFGGELRLLRVAGGLWPPACNE